MPEKLDFRRSETVAQQQYEQELHAQQGLHEDVSTDDLNTEFDDKMNVSEHDTVDGSDAPAEQDGEQPKKRGLVRRKMRGFYENVIKPAFPEAIQDLKIMTGMSNLEARVKKEMQDAELFPEVEHVAHVRRGIELCPEEQAFLAKRKLLVRDAFAKYMGVDLEEVHPDDVPTVSFGGSGGGFRAMIGCLGYCEEMRKTGLWDCLTYVSGVSGSCWSLAAYYSFGHANMQNVIDHCKKRFSPYHPLSGDAIRTILSAPGGARVTLGPLIQKSKSGLQTVAMDLYSVFTTGWIFFQEDPIDVPGGSAQKEVAGYQKSWHKYSAAREYTDDGLHPLPIMTAIRHERPWRDWHDKEHPFKEPDHATGDHAEATDAWFQWFEFTPYEIGCDEIAAWCPTWGFGRPFSEGKSTMQLPEQSLALLLGLATSAPAGPLTSYISTISRNLPANFLGNSIHKLAHGITRMWGKQGTEEFQNHHPLHACNEHNFMFHYTPVEQGQGRPPGLENSPRIHLIDSGMDNNCPTYVLLHPSRQADVIINMDASSDVQKDTFPERVDQIGGRRGLKFTRRELDPSLIPEHPPTATPASVNTDTATVTPSAAAAASDPPLPPPPETPEPSTTSTDPSNAEIKYGANGDDSTPSAKPHHSHNPFHKIHRKKDAHEPQPEKESKAPPAEPPKDPDRFQGLYAQIYDGVPCARPDTVVDSYGRTVTNPPAPIHAGECSMIYMPLLPNERAVQDFDPSTAKFSGSYNLVWTPEQVDMLVDVCRANFRDGEPAIKRAMHEAWQRKKRLRATGAAPAEQTRIDAVQHQQMRPAAAIASAVVSAPVTAVSEAAPVAPHPAA